MVPTTSECSKSTLKFWLPKYRMPESRCACTWTHCILICWHVDIHTNLHGSHQSGPRNQARVELEELTQELASSLKKDPEKLSQLSAKHSASEKISGSPDFSLCFLDFLSTWPNGPLRFLQWSLLPGRFGAKIPSTYVNLSVVNLRDEEIAESKQSTNVCNQKIESQKYS